MNQHKAEPALEISPDHRIEVPLFNTPGNHIPAEVHIANEHAADQINTEKDAFIFEALSTLLTDEQIGELELQHLNDDGAFQRGLLALIDPTKIRLTLRNDYGPTLVLPSQADPTNPKQKALVRQTGHTLHLEYDSRWIGTMEINYDLTGKINIQTQTHTNNQ